MLPKSQRTATAPIPITLPKLLLVEGDTPSHFFEALLRHIGISEQIEIRSFQGVQQFAGFVQAIASTTEFREHVKSLGIIRDAEQHPAESARESVSDALNRANLVSPYEPPLEQIRIFILPDDSGPGMIETLLMTAVRQKPESADLCSCLDAFFACVSNCPIAELPSGLILAKHQVQVYLATRKKAQLAPGVASYHQSWPWESPAFHTLIEFIRSL